MTATLTPKIGVVASRAAQYYLNQHPLARQYLHDRGLNDQDIIDWQFGFWCDEAVRVLIVSGFDEGEIARAGLNSRLNGRIVCPLYDPAGRPCGLVGRTIPPDESKIKWLYPPDNPHYLSSAHLFGLHQVLERQLAGPTVLVEGPFDVVLPQKFDIPTVSAHHVTFTSTQAALIRALNRDELILAPDPDEAGEAMVRSAKKHRQHLPRLVRVASLPHDPASTVQTNPLQFAQALHEAMPL